MVESSRAYWMSYKEHLAELVGVFQTAMVDERFAERWREIRVAGIVTIREGIERAQAEGYCPDSDPWLTAAALGSMLEHFCYVSLAQGGAFTDRPFDEAAAIRTIASIWYHAVYWKAPGPRPGAPDLNLRVGSGNAVRPRRRRGHPRCSGSMRSWTRRPSCSCRSSASASSGRRRGGRP